MRGVRLLEGVPERFLAVGAEALRDRVLFRGGVAEGGEKVGPEVGSQKRAWGLGRWGFVRIGLLLARVRVRSLITTDGGNIHKVQTQRAVSTCTGSGWEMGRSISSA